MSNMLICMFRTKSRHKVEIRKLFMHRILFIFAADQQEADNIPLVAGLVSLLVVVAAVIAGIAFCLYRQKTKRSLTSGTSPSTDPNIYSESPTVTDSNSITHDDPPPSYAEVEYEEAATVKPPVIPPRANRP